MLVRNGKRLKVEVFELLVGALLALDTNGKEHVGVVVRGIASITHWLTRSSADRWFSLFAAVMLNNVPEEVGILWRAAITCRDPKAERLRGRRSSWRTETQMQIIWPV